MIGENSKFRGQRFQEADSSQLVDVGVDMPSQLISEMKARRPKVFTSFNDIDLSTARDINSNPMELEVPSWWMVGWIYSTADATKAPVNGMVQVRVMENKPENEFRLRSGRHTPFGPTIKVYLGWAAQAGKSLDLMFCHYKYFAMPYADTQNT